MERGREGREGSSRNGAKSEGELWQVFLDVATLISEARVPGLGHNGRGYGEGPHCPLPYASVLHAPAVHTCTGDQVVPSCTEFVFCFSSSGLTSWGSWAAGAVPAAGESAAPRAAPVAERRGAVRRSAGRTRVRPRRPLRPPRRAGRQRGQRSQLFADRTLDRLRPGRNVI